jgi:hypothetical protein
MYTCDDTDWEHDAPFEPVGSKLMATGNVTKWVVFRRTFTKSPVIVKLIDNGYRMLWETSALAAKKSPNAP